MNIEAETPTQPHPQKDQLENLSIDAPKLERSDEVLQLSRRVDWRFLLPSPSLGKVAFVGPGQGEHFTALQRFCASLVRIDDKTAHGTDFDLVVIHAGESGDLDFAKKLLQPGGFLYWEIDRKVLFKRSQRAAAFRHFQYFMKQAKKAGFGEIEVFWHRPNFKSCLEIIPLDSRVSLAAAFGKRGGNFKKQMKFLIGAFLWKSGLLSRVAPCVSIVGRKM